MSKLTNSIDDNSNVLLKSNIHIHIKSLPEILIILVCRRYADCIEYCNFKDTCNKQ